MTRRRLGSVSKLTSVLLAFAGSAMALPSANAQVPGASTRPVTPVPPFSAGWSDGFVIQNSDGDYRLRIGVFAQFDGRFTVGGVGSPVDTFAVRRLRPYLRGRIADRFEFYMSPDFAGSSASLQDAYLDTRFSSAFRVRIGKAKTPFGLERGQSDASTLFLERALPSALTPNRDVGVHVLGDARGGTVFYDAAILNGVADDGSGDVDSNDAKDFAARVQVRPFDGAGAGRLRALRGLGLGFGGTIGKESGPGQLPSFRTSVVPEMFLTYAGAVADGTRRRYSPQAYYYRGRFGGFGEFVHSEMPIRRGSVRETIGHDAWQIAGSLFLTGDAATDGTVRPARHFDFGDGGHGALQVAARYHALSVDRDALALGLAGPGSSRTAHAWTLGLNWFWNPYIKHVVNFERTVLDDGSGSVQRGRNALAFRSQIMF